MNDSAIYLNPSARSWRSDAPKPAARAFHRSLPGYAPTGLIDVTDVVGELAGGRVFVKDESERFGLPAFKVLGAAYAIARALSQRLGADRTLGVDELADRDFGRLGLVAATDGNHGRAVARVAAMIRLPATILVPAGVSEAARRAIVDEGAELVVLHESYDEVVRAAAVRAGDETLLIQDTAWDGYTDIPRAIVDGYDTLLAEVDEQLGAIGVAADLVVVPAGVGSLAHAVVAHYRRGAGRPAILVVEPEAAPAVHAALSSGAPVTVPTADTVMTGLNCGTVSELAWPVLRDGLDAAITVTDRAARDAMTDLAALDVDAGPCGAATLAGLRALVADAAWQRLGLGGDAVVVLLSTEGRAANPVG